MALEIVTIPCLADNYAYLVHGPDGTCLIDAPEAAPILAALDLRGWRLGTILLTHHHADHTQAVPAIRAATGARVMGPAAEAAKLPPLDHALADGEAGGEGAALTVALAVPGHTLGHMAYHFPNAGAVFTADSLMAGGCGRMFEGTPPVYWASLSRLAALPGDTRIYSGHEYTAANLRFAQTLEPDNPALTLRMLEVAAARAAGRPTVPSLVAEERATNPFLRAGMPAIRATLGVPEDAPAEAAFAAVRAAKDRF
jgi:hydroxyacylglutathione hydrolase